ncbi:hypothetical protein LJB99_03265 [Deltaproteobacteria bacterium OttesenSCG-928-K17]|nr:hypothetical protein [Deltaproteobacteria bacterium OttesenSCG-928-K17]
MWAAKAVFRPVFSAVALFFLAYVVAFLVTAQWRFEVLFLQHADFIIIIFVFSASGQERKLWLQAHEAYLSIIMPKYPLFFYKDRYIMLFLGDFNEN